MYLHKRNRGSCRVTRFWYGSRIQAWSQRDYLPSEVSQRHPQIWGQFYLFTMAVQGRECRPMCKTEWMCEAFGDALVLLFVKGRFIAIENLSSQYMAEHTEAVDTVRQTRHKMLTAKLSHLDATRVPYWFYELKTPLAKHHGQCSSPYNLSHTEEQKPVKTWYHHSTTVGRYYSMSL